MIDNLLWFVDAMFLISLSPFSFVLLQENLRAIQARNRFEARQDRERSDHERLDLADGGENAAEVMLRKQRLEEKEWDKQCVIMNGVFLKNFYHHGSP